MNEHSTAVKKLGFLFIPTKIFWILVFLRLISIWYWYVSITFSACLKKQFFSYHYRSTNCTVRSRGIWKAFSSQKIGLEFADVSLAYAVLVTERIYIDSTRICYKYPETFFNGSSDVCQSNQLSEQMVRFHTYFQQWTYFLRLILFDLYCWDQTWNINTSLTSTYDRGAVKALS